MGPDATSRPLFAAAHVIAAMALIGLIDGVVAVIAQSAGLWQFHLLRAALALAVLGGLAATLGLRLRPRRAWAVLLRGGLIAVSMLFYFGALAWLSVAEASAGVFTAPLFVMVITWVGLRRAVPWATVLAGLLGFAGAMMVLQPELGGASWVRLMPIAAAIFYAGGAVVTRELCAEESTLALLVGFFACLLVFGALGVAALGLSGAGALAPPGAEGFLTRAWAPLGPVTWALVGVQALGALVGVGLITRAYLLAPAPFVSVFEYVLLIFAAAWGWLIWGQGLDGLALAGIAVILLSGLLLAQSERARGAGQSVRAGARAGP